MKKRLFYAIDLPKDIKEQFQACFNKLGDEKAIKLEKSEKLHLTLIFLGAVDEQKISQLTLLLDSIRVNYKPFQLRITPAVFAFPTISNPRVLWIPIKGDITTLQNIVDTLQKLLRDKDFRLEKRPFSVHLTLGRFRNNVKKSQKQKVVYAIADVLPKKPLTFTVEGITFFESTLTPKGSVYNILHYADFRD